MLVRDIAGVEGKPPGRQLEECDSERVEVGSAGDAREGRIAIALGFQDLEGASEFAAVLEQLGEMDLELGRVFVGVPRRSSRTLGRVLRARGP